MRHAAVSLLTLLLATTGMAQLTPGFTVRSAEPFPLIADFNGDGLDDLVQERNVLINNGGSFTAYDLKLPQEEKVIAVLDVNGDHIVDLLTQSQTIQFPTSTDPNQRPGDRGYRLYIGDAMRTYNHPINVASGPPPYVADVDGDGRDDIVLMADIRPDGFRTVATEVTILRSNGDGTFERLDPFRVGVSPQIWFPDFRILAGDLNHDGITDLVMRGPDDLMLLRGLGGGRFAVENRYMPETVDYGWWSNRLADVDGDSNLDIILAGLRNIRVLYGDGHGNFPRASRTAIDKLHDANVPPNLAFLNVDQLNQPRDLAVGHFTRADQTQIAAGTGEGDIAIFAYEQGALREVSRTSTDFWMLTVRAGNFHNAGLTDLFAMGTLIWGEMYPQPRLFYGASNNAPATNTIAAAGRSRASRAGNRTIETPMQVEIRGECIDPSSDRLTFIRDSIFGAAQHGTTRMETVFDGSTIYFRITAPYTVEAAKGVLTESNGQYSGTALVLTSCGWKTMSVTATMQ